MLFVDTASCGTRVDYTKTKDDMTPTKMSHKTSKCLPRQIRRKEKDSDVFFAFFCAFCSSSLHRRKDFFVFFCLCWRRTAARGDAATGRRTLNCRSGHAATAKSFF